jgi:hypothetical protein
MNVQIVTPYRVSHLQRYGVTVSGNVTSVNPSVGTESQWYNCYVIGRGNGVEHACPEAKRWQPHHWTA